MGLNDRPIEDVLREHRRFIFALAGGAVALLVGLAMIAEVEASAAAIARDNQRTEGEIADLSEELRGERFEAGLERTLVKTALPGARADVELPQRPEFTLKEGDSPYIAYGRIRERVQVGTRGELQRKNIACPDDLGLVEQPPEDRVKEAAATADLADRVLSALLESGVRKVETFHPGEADFVPVVTDAAPPVGAPKADAPRDDGAAPAEEAPVLRRLPLRFTVVLSTADLQGLLARFQRAGSCLEIAAARVVRLAAVGASSVADAGLLRAEIEVAGLALVPAAEARASGARPGATTPGRRPIAPRTGGRR